MMKIAIPTMLSILILYSLQSLAASDSVDNCISIQSASWSSQEQWVWERICNGDDADLNVLAGFTERLIPWEAESNEWGENRVLTSSFLYDILLKDPYVSEIRNTPVIIFGAWFQDLVLFRGANISNFLRLEYSRFDENFVIVSGALEHRFTVFNSWFRKDLVFRNLTTQPIIFENAKFDGSLEVWSTSTTGQLSLLGAEYNGYVNLTASRADALVLGSNLDNRPIWQDGANFSARGLQVRRLIDRPFSWEGLQGRIDLQGFTYEQFAGGGDAADVSAASAAERPVESLLSWIEMQESRDEVYIPNPYEQLASVLYELGQTAKANRILYEKNEYLRSHITTPFSEKVWLNIKKLVIGYGYQIWLTIIWLFSLIGFGALIMFQSSQGKPLGLGRCCLYSLDQAIPLIDLDPKHQDLAREQSDGLDYYFKAQQILSLILITFIGAGLAGAIG